MAIWKEGTLMCRTCHGSSCPMAMQELLHPIRASEPIAPEVHTCAQEVHDACACAGAVRNEMLKKQICELFEIRPETILLNDGYESARAEAEEERKQFLAYLEEQEKMIFDAAMKNEVSRDNQ